MSGSFRMTAGEVAEATGGRVALGDPATTFAEVTTDSRAAAKGALFVALVGDNFDGHDFIEAATASGVSGVVCRVGGVPDLGEARTRGVVVIEVDDTLHALGAIAHAHRSRFDLKVIAVTGSNGKTTTKEMLRGVLQAEYGAAEVLATKGNLNNLIGVPLTLFGLEPRHRVAVIEMGMNAPGEIARLTEIADPDVGVITCVGEAHLAGLGSLEGVAAAKGELFDGLRKDAVAVVNLDDAMVVARAQGLGQRRVGFSLDGTPAMEGAPAVSACSLRLDDLERSQFELTFGARTASVDLPLGGRHNVSNALAAAAVGVALGLDLDVVARGLAQTDPPPMRMSPQELSNGVLLVNDAYNANPASFRAALDVMADGASGRCIIVVGDMLELGPNAAEWHSRAGAQAASLKPQLLCAMGEFAPDVVAGAITAGLSPTQARVCADRDEAAGAVIAVWKAGDTVLVKGSRGSAMEKVVDSLRREASPL